MIPNDFFYEWPVFSLAPNSWLCYNWLTYMMNSKKSDRMNTNDIGIVVMVRKLKKTINPPRFLNSMGSPSF